MIIHDHISCCYYPEMVSGVIGKYYDHACQYVNIDNGYQIDFLNVPLYVPSANGSMSCEELQQHYDELKFQIQGWQSRMVSANSTERQNIVCVLNTQQAKLAEYQARLIDCNKIPSTTEYTNTSETGEHQTTTPEVVDTTEPATTDNTMLYVLGAGVAAFAIYRARKNKRRSKK